MAERKRGGSVAVVGLNGLAGGSSSADALSPVHRPVMVDLFCGAGGMTRGFQGAGFYVIGVDLEEQPDYCGDEFIQADAIQFLADLLTTDGWVGDNPVHRIVAAHASPPCHAYTTMGQKHPETQAQHPALIADTREALKALGIPFVIENVPGARKELDHPLQLCGRAFGLGVGRHRLFECSRFSCMGVQCQCDGNELPVYGKLDGRRVWTRVDGSELRAARTLEQAQSAMGIDWMPWDRLTQAIPPAYAEHIGSYLMAAVRSEAVAA